MVHLEECYILGVGFESALRCELISQWWRVSLAHTEKQNEIRAGRDYCRKMTLKAYKLVVSKSCVCRARSLPRDDSGMALPNGGLGGWG